MNLFERWRWRAVWWETITYGSEGRVNISIPLTLLYILATLYRDSESATSAGLKYFLLGGFSSCLILLGIGLIYSYTGLTNFESIYLLNSISGIDQPTVLQGLSLGLIIIFVGFLFKIAAAPLHNWSPEIGLWKSSIVGIKLSNSGNTL